jgi:hypothetical protein
VPPGAGADRRRAEARRDADAAFHGAAAPPAGSVLPAQGGASPALTVMALADRAADRLIAGARGPAADGGAEEPAVTGPARRPGHPAVERLDVSAYRAPTDAPEADATLGWDATGMVLVQAHVGAMTGVAEPQRGARQNDSTERQRGDGHGHGPLTGPDSGCPGRLPPAG